MVPENQTLLYSPPVQVCQHLDESFVFVQVGEDLGGVGQVLGQQRLELLGQQCRHLRLRHVAMAVAAKDHILDVKSDDVLRTR